MKKEKYVVVRKKEDWFGLAYVESNGLDKNGNKKYKINADDKILNKALLKRCKGGYSFKTSSLKETLKHILLLKSFYMETLEENEKKRK